MIHALLTVGFIALAEHLFGWGIAAGWLAAAFFFGREHAQAEYRVIEHNYDGLRGPGPWWLGFEPRAWTIKGMADWVLPLLVAVGYWRL